MFRLIGLHPGPDIDPYACAALTNIRLELAQHLLGGLARAHLVQPAGSGRYSMHDLLRSYATHLTTDEDSEDERRAALTRLFDHYLATAAAAMDMLVPTEQHRRPRIPPVVTPSPPLVDITEARAWLDGERSALTKACAHTVAHGWPDHVIRLAGTLFRYLDAGGHYADALTIHTHALHAARNTRDRSAEAHSLANLGTVYWRQSRYWHAADYFEQARALAREIGDLIGEARALANLGNVDEHQGRYQQAAEHHQQALTIFRETADSSGEADVLNGLGETHHTLGQLPEACIQHTAALTLAIQIGERYEQARAHNGLAHIHHSLGDPAQARVHWCQALTVYTHLGVPEADEVQTHLAILDQTDYPTN